MPLLARMLAAPLRHRRAARRRGQPRRRCWPTAASPPRAGSRWRSGPTQGDSIAAELNIADAEIFPVPDGSHDTAVSAGQAAAGGRLRGRGRDRRRQDHRRDQVRRPHGRHPDGRRGDQPGPRRHRLAGQLAGARVRQGLLRRGPCPSPSSSTSTGSAARPHPMDRAGIGDVVSNLSAVADWELSAADTGEHVDGLAAAMARSAAQAVLNQPGGGRPRTSSSPCWPRR